VSVRATIRYSEAFKLQVLRELEEGKFPSMTAAARAYGISGLGMVKYWAEKYGKSHLVGKVVRVETAKEVSEVKELRKRVRDLEKALANERLDHLLDEAYLQIACRRAGVTDVEEFKKKHAGKA
jgi:transposase-like protein